MSATVSAAPTRGNYDHARRKRSKRGGREKGCWIYIAGEELEKHGYTAGGELPYYRVWSSPRGVLLRLYRVP